MRNDPPINIGGVRSKALFQFTLQGPDTASLFRASQDFEGKMRAIFSMLFGAGMLVLTSRLEQRGAAAESADIYHRRLLWLVAFGLAHAYFVWWGDILFFYGVLGFKIPERSS